MHAFGPEHKNNDKSRHNLLPHPRSATDNDRSDTGTHSVTVKHSQHENHIIITIYVSTGIHPSTQILSKHEAHAVEPSNTRIMM